MGCILGGDSPLANVAGMATAQLDERAKKYAAWILDTLCKGDASKIVGAKVVVNPRIDGFGLGGAKKFTTTCEKMDFETGYITLHGGDYPTAETIWCQRVHSITLKGGQEVLVPQLGV
jgi:hypothetical protein